MEHLPVRDEDSLVRYIQLLTEAIQRKFVKNYQVEMLSNRGRSAYYLIKNKENSAHNFTVMGRGTSWTFTMNEGLNRLVIEFNNKRLLDNQGLISLLDIVRGTISYEYTGTPPYTYRSGKNKLSLEEYIYSGAREVNVDSTLRPISEVWLEELNLMKRNQNHFLVTLITAQIAAQFINYGLLEERRDEY